MSISNPPLRDPPGDQWSRTWATWFTQLMSAIFGWRKTYTGTKTLDFGLIAAGAEAALTVTVTGARTNDAVVVTPSAKTAGIIDNVGIVTANDTVSVYAHNITAGGINPASKDYRIVVFQQ